MTVKTDKNTLTKDKEFSGDDNSTEDTPTTDDDFVSDYDSTIDDDFAPADDDYDSDNNLDQDEYGHLDLQSRELCPDGTCIGLIGPDRRCKICGALAQPKTKTQPKDTETASNLSFKTPVEEKSGPVNLKDRILCSDGNCIGVIGENGLCKVCQKPYNGESNEPHE